MTVTIIPCDGVVVKDGVAYMQLDFSSAGIPTTVHALQWQGTSGWVEHTDLTNEPIAALPDWAETCLAIWQAADDDANAPPPEPGLEEIRAQIQEQRHAAYTAEADPLFFQYQRGEAAQQKWLDKVDEIRARYPYPDA